MQSVLDRAGYMSVPVHDPMRLEQMIDMERPNLILLDVVMPQRNGFQACRELKGNADYARIPVVMVSSKNTESDKFWAKQQGADGYVVKPFTNEELLGAVRGLVGKSFCEIPTFTLSLRSGTGREPYSHGELWVEDSNSEWRTLRAYKNVAIPHPQSRRVRDFRKRECQKSRTNSNRSRRKLSSLNCCRRRSRSGNTACFAPDASASVSPCLTWKKLWSGPT